jgi:hypothetical protein
MRRRIPLLVALALLAVEPARGHVGSDPTPTRLTLQGSDRLVFSTNVGLVLSDDRGATWRWICELAIGPPTEQFRVDFDGTPSGALFATTPEGLYVSHNGGCGWGPVPGGLLGMDVVDLAVAADGTVFALSDEPEVEVWRSRDDGASIIAIGPPPGEARWTTIRAAPGDPLRLYLAGEVRDPGAMAARMLVLEISDDGGDTWRETTLTEPDAIAFEVAAVSPIDPDVAFARVNGDSSDRLIRFAGGGATHETVLEMAGDLGGVAVAADGSTVVAGDRSGIVRSVDAGHAFTPVEGAPEMVCAASAADGTLYACGFEIDPGYVALRRSVDGGLTWTDVLQMCEIRQHASCAADTPLAATCVATWPDPVVVFKDCDAAPPPRSCGCGIGLALGIAAFAGMPAGRRRPWPSDG